MDLGVVVVLVVLVVLVAVFELPVMVVANEEEVVAVVEVVDFHATAMRDDEVDDHVPRGRRRLCCATVLMELSMWQSTGTKMSRLAHFHSKKQFSPQSKVPGKLVLVVSMVIATKPRFLSSFRISQNFLSKELA